MANWIASLAGLLSVASAALSWWVSREIRAIEAQRDRRAQTTRVSSWVTHVFRDTGEGEEPLFNGVVILNNSDAAIFDVEIEAAMGSDKDQTACKASVCPPGELLWKHNGSRGRFRWDLPTPTSAIRGASRPYARSAQWRVISLSFTDGNGVRWRREEHGAFAEVT